MTLFDTMGISATGLNARRFVIDLISMNLANVQTTRTDSGEPYRRRRAVLSHVPGGQPFADILLNRVEMTGHLRKTHFNHFPQAHFLPWEAEERKGGVRAEMVEDGSAYKMIHDPSHPDADESGHVLLPNINAVEEMVELLAAVRGFEANITAFNAAKNMALKSLEIGR
jgi:flagellar basal-body rod protein FlgC